MQTQNIREKIKSAIKSSKNVLLVWTQLSPRGCWKCLEKLFFKYNWEIKRWAENWKLEKSHQQLQPERGGSRIGNMLVTRGTEHQSSAGEKHKDIFLPEYLTSHVLSSRAINEGWQSFRPCLHPTVEREQQTPAEYLALVKHNWPVLEPNFDLPLCETELVGHLYPSPPGEVVVGVKLLL